MPVNIGTYGVGQNMIPRGRRFLGPPVSVGPGTSMAQGLGAAGPEFKGPPVSADEAPVSNMRDKFGGDLDWSMLNSLLRSSLGNRQVLGPNEPWMNDFANMFPGLSYFPPWKMAQGQGFGPGGGLEGLNRLRTLRLIQRILGSPVGSTLGGTMGGSPY